MGTEIDTCIFNLAITHRLVIGTMALRLATRKFGSKLLPIRTSFLHSHATSFGNLSLSLHRHGHV